MITVKATREGLLGEITSTGYKIDKYVPFVALPDAHALYEVVRVRANGKQVLALVMDVGPWNIHDSDYVFGNSRPQAESGTDLYGRKTNGAGIDLSEYVWNHLDMQDNGNVDWEFVEKGT